jgi:hypothetical protein
MPGTDSHRRTVLVLGSIITIAAEWGMDMSNQRDKGRSAWRWRNLAALNAVQPYIDYLVKGRKTPFLVIPKGAGIQEV